MLTLGSREKKFVAYLNLARKVENDRKLLQLRGGGEELLKSINNTLGELMEVQDRSEPAKGHLLRSRLPPATLIRRKSDSPLDDV